MEANVENRQSERGMDAADSRPIRQSPSTRLPTLKPSVCGEPTESPGAPPVKDRRNGGLRILVGLLKLTAPVIVLMTSVPAGYGQHTFTYTNEGGTITITKYIGYRIGDAFYVNVDVIIPAEIDGLPVTRIGDRAFQQLEIPSAAIPDSVTTIGNYAFYHCQKLNSVTIGNGVTRIGSLAFSGCSLYTVSIPSSITAIGSRAFYECYGLTYISIGSSVIDIGGGAFRSCSSLRAITVDGSNPAFSGLGGVLFNKSQTTLIQYPASKSGGEYTIPNGITTIGNAAFRGCSGLSSVIFPNSVINIGGEAFGYCTRLTNIAIPNGVRSIGDSALEGCQGLTSVSIPDTVTNIGISAFQHCSGLTSVTIPNSVVSIGNSAFRYCSGLTIVNIGNRVTSIEDYTFYVCYGLISITIPNSVTNIGNRAFGFCNSLTDVYFQGSAPIAGDNVFVGAPAIIKFLPGTLGWGATFADRPTEPWVLPYPLILTSSPGPGVRSNEFGFTISWATNVPVVVEACADLAKPAWTSLKTNTLVNGAAYFSDPDSVNHPSRFYRVGYRP